MFQEIEREFSMARWVGQLLIAYCLPTMLVWLAESPFRRADTPILQVSDYLLIGLIGGCSGIGLHRVSPDSTKEGARVWLLPTAILAVAMTYDALSGAGCFLCSFYAGQGDPNPFPVIVTLPTWGCIWYSAAIWGRRRHRSHAGI
jgi:hypothetical protein